MKITLFAVLFVVVVAGCISSPVCSPPYIRVAYDCCLDQNSNSICDRDEPSPPSTGQDSQLPDDGTDVNVADDALPDDVPSSEPPADVPEEPPADLGTWCEPTNLNELEKLGFEIHMYDLKQYNYGEFYDEYNVGGPLEMRLSLRRTNYKDKLTHISAELKSSSKYAITSSQVIDPKDLDDVYDSDYVYLIWRLVPNEEGEFPIESKLTYLANGKPRTICSKIKLHAFESEDDFQLSIINYTVAKQVPMIYDYKTYYETVMQLDNAFELGLYQGLDTKAASSGGDRYSGLNYAGSFAGEPFKVEFGRTVYIQSDATKMCKVGNLLRSKTTGKNTYYLEFYRDYYDAACVRSLCGYPARAIVEVAHDGMKKTAYTSVEVSKCPS
ncbi:MAG: hypothetical protein ABH829_00565 [archaeon]